ncbi:alpha/beta hydrolase [Anaerosporobacter sp.]
MRKKIIVGMMVMVLISSLTGCSSGKRNNKVEDTSQQTAEVTAQDTSVEESENKGTEEMENSNQAMDRIKVYEVFEANLGITEEQRNGFIEKYGVEVYETALSSCKYFLKLNNNTVLNDDTLKPFQEKYQVEEVEIPSSLDGHKIPADYIIVDGDKNRDTIIFVHGQGGTRRSNLGIANYFLEMGFNVLTFDLRNSGENKAPLTTFGALEKYDLLDCIEYIDKQIESDQKIIISGASYGGSVVANTLGTDIANEKVDAAILDCPVASMEMILNVRMLQYVSPENLDYTYECCDKFMDYMYGFTMKDADGVQSMSKNTIPTLLITSEADNVVPKENAEALYNTIPGDKKYLKVFKDVAHVDAINAETDTYLQLVKDLLDGSLFE